MRHKDLTNAEWKRLEPLLPASETRRGRRNDHRTMINGVLYQARTRSPWRELPDRFGCWFLVYKHHRRWSATGIWYQLLTAVQAAQEAEGHVYRGISVDPDIIQAHDVSSISVDIQAKELIQARRRGSVLESLAGRLTEVVKLGKG
jgi:transposase